MPLPPNSTISLQGHSRPGEGTTTMPKIAMVIRMTDETLDALQSLSGADRMDFEFGDKPGIFVRDQFFPMRYDKEKDNQELFIRTTMATRPNPPLKLNANVVGKFTVEHVLSDKITQRVHNATAAAAKQKAERKTIMLDSPLAEPTTTQKSAPKKKVPAKSTGKATPTIVKSYANSSSQPTPVASPSAPSLPKELATQYRQRLVHYLALGPATVQDIFKEFGGSDVDHTIRTGIMDLLIEVGEHEQVSRKAASTSQVTKWQLKPQTWLEIRPYQYSGYTDNVRTKVARTARNWLQSLRIPENDPAWDHVKFRDSGHAATSSGSNAVQRPTNGMTSATAKKAKIKRNPDTKVISESASSTYPKSGQTGVSVRTEASGDRANTPVHSIKGKGRETDTEKEEGELSASQTPPRLLATVDRRPPGSRPSGASTPLMQPPPVPASPRPPPSSKGSSVISKQTGPVDARGVKRVPPEPSERARAAPPIPPPVPIERKVTAQPKKEIVQVKKERVAPLGSGNVITPLAGSSLPLKDREVARREKERESDLESLRVSRRETDRESDRESARGRDKDRMQKGQGKVRDREQGRPKGKTKDKEQTSSQPVKSSTKRKPSETSDEESSDWGIEERRKIRKSTLSSTIANTTKIKRERESVPIKTSTPSVKTLAVDQSLPKQKIKREASPPPVSKTKPVLDRKAAVGSSSAVPTVSKKTDGAVRSANGKSLKRQRLSIDFTSSSDEEEEEPAPKSVKSSAKTMASSVAKASGTGSAVSDLRSRPPKHIPPQSKREQLRVRYQTIYNEYIMVFQQLVAKKNKFDAIIRYGSESASEQSDMEMDATDLEKVGELRARYQRLHDELEGIRKTYEA